MNNDNVKCPKCGFFIDIHSAIYKEIESDIKSKFDERERNWRIEDQRLKQKEAQINQQVQQEVETKLKSEQYKLSSALKQKLEQEFNEKNRFLEKELNEKSQKINELYKLSAENEKLKREKDEIESKIRAESETNLNKQLQVERDKINKSAEERNDLKLREAEEKLKQIQEQLKIAQRKAEQGDMRLQGEVQELVIEEWLKDNFPFDSIIEIKKGANGSDCEQIVNSRENINCGKIYYESKRTKSFSESWIDKLKEDMQRETKLDENKIGVIVSETLPKDIKRIGIKNGIWICSLEDFKFLAPVLREQLIKIDKIKKSNEHKSDKMSYLYSYLTSEKFSQQIGNIINGFTDMQKLLDDEKKSMIKIWKKREKHLEIVRENAMNMVGSIEGIAGGKFLKLDKLELDYIAKNSLLDFDND